MPRPPRHRGPLLTAAVAAIAISVSGCGSSSGLPDGQRSAFVKGCSGEQRTGDFCGCVYDKLVSSGVDSVESLKRVYGTADERQPDARFRKAYAGCLEDVSVAPGPGEDDPATELPAAKPK